MATRAIPVCDKCGNDVTPNPPIGHLQGGTIHIVLGAIRWQITLCERCKKPLHDLYEEYVEVVLPDGMVLGEDKLEFLPRADEPIDGIDVSLPQFSEDG